MQSLISFYSGNHESPRKFTLGEKVRVTDRYISGKLFGNGAGILNNFKGKTTILRNRLMEDEQQDADVEQLWEQGYQFLPEDTYGEELISSLRDNFSALISDSENYVPRGTNRKGESYGRTLKDTESTFPEVMELITGAVEQKVRAYFQSDFSIDKINAWRIEHIPKESRDSEIFSDFWHFDQDRTDTLKLFVLLSDVTEKDGPTHFHPRSSTKEILNRGYIFRGVYGSSKKIIEDPDRVKTVTGSAGTGLLCNLQHCLHRADIPEKNRERDLVQFKFRPS